MTDSVVTTAVRALLRSRLLSPPSPVAGVRLIREARRGGTNPYTLLAVTAARSPDRAAIIDDDGALTFASCGRKRNPLPGSCPAVGPVPVRRSG